MLKIKSFASLSVLCAATTLLLSACGGDDKTAANTAANNAGSANAPAAIELKVGVCPGPYGQMLEQTIAPLLKDKGYSLTVVEFTDYVQPNLALDGGDIDANLMQHQAYLDTFVQNQGVKLKAATSVPTLGMGVFAHQLKSFEELANIKDGKVAIPNDAVNLARALRLARDLNLITLKADLDENKASVGDIDQNPYNLEFVPMEAAQISRSLDSVTLGFIPGNYAFAAHLDYHTALGIEQVAEDIKNVVAVRSDDTKTEKLFFEIVHSPEFKQNIEQSAEFSTFIKPQWWDSVAPKADASAAPAAPASADAPAAADADSTAAATDAANASAADKAA